jgi:mannitol-1-/sugar-/sorbitol-6-/2-deoxyglucose-6-phosphatase
MAIEAVIFDMDGVLVDSEVYWHLSREEFARARGKVWTDALQRLAMGRSTVEWAHVMKEHLDLSESIDEIIREMKARVIAHYEQRLPDRPGALDAVRTLAGRYRVSLASGSPTEIIERVMQLTGLDQVFEHIVYGDTIERGKPAPDIYLEAMRRMGLQADVCVGVEDSSNGIRSLHAAGMYIIAAPSPDFPLTAEIVALSHAHIASMEDLTVDLVEQLRR